MIRAIIVEDDLMVASINKQYLSLVREIQLAASFYNGNDAWAYLQTNPVDLMILDVFMPGMNGLDLLANIRKKQLPLDVIMVTAANDTQSLDTAMRLGALDYLVKPFSFDRFRLSLQKFLSRRRVLDENETLPQLAIDKMIGSKEYNEKEQLSKGMQDKTLNKLRELMQNAQGRMLTCDEIAASSGLSRVTVRRYMNYMIDAGEVVSEVDYRTGGRPSIQYRYVSSETAD